MQSLFSSMQSEISFSSDSSLLPLGAASNLVFLRACARSPSVSDLARAVVFSSDLASPSSTGSTPSTASFGLASARAATASVPNANRTTPSKSRRRMARVYAHNSALLQRIHELLADLRRPPRGAHHRGT